MLRKIFDAGLSEGGKGRNQDISPDAQQCPLIKGPLFDSRDPGLVSDEAVKLRGGGVVVMRFGFRADNLAPHMIELRTLGCADLAVDLLERPKENPERHARRSD